jgi:hypothetical protein
MLHDWHVQESRTVSPFSSSHILPASLTTCRNGKYTKAVEAWAFATHRCSGEFLYSAVVHYLVAHLGKDDNSQEGIGTGHGVIGLLLIFLLVAWGPEFGSCTVFLSDSRTCKNSHLEGTECGKFQILKVNAKLDMALQLL